MTSRNAAETDAVLDAYRKQIPLGQGRAERAMRAAMALARPAEALEFARRLYMDDLAAEPRATMLPYVGLDTNAERPTGALFLQPARRLWSQPGFLPMMSRLGLVAYWRTSGPPDLCLIPEVASSCRFVGIGR